MEQEKVSLSAVVKAKGLTKAFRDCLAVDAIDFSVFKEECFGFLGPNGAGKTTTVRMVSCFIEPSSGYLEVLGREAQKEPRLIKARIGVCQQENNLDPDLTVEDNLRVFARYFDIVGKDAKARCEELLHFVGLYQKRKSAIDELSGGMKRRLMIARSLVNSPDLLILDEPTTGLDPQARHQVWESVMRLKKEGTTVVLTTHYMDEAAHLCDRIVIMDKGKIIVSGSPKELIRQAVTSHVIEIYSGSPGIEGYLKDKGLAYEKTLTHFFVYSQHGPQAFEEISSKFGHGISTLRMANLEDVFLKLTGRELRE
ncbi:MAG: ABC transporter ATP-binding protein [Candidatus Omnitrophica bacterium]|nr:ABC transporter ATP-binding protein [Candidatus Omnitrophota bacterium]